jgi:heme exporter protein B
LRIEVDALGSRRSGRRVFEGVSFALGAGQALVVTGRNGAGKSTLLAILAGSLNADQGTVALSGAGERTLPECLHFVGHRDGLKGALTARENLIFACDLLGDPGLSPEDALDAVGLAHAAALPVAYLSAGQRRRVALARLLVARRSVWLLDEPTAALDAPAQERLLALMRGHLASGGLLIAATHAPLDLPGANELRLDRESSSVQAQAKRSDPGEGRVTAPKARKPVDAGGWRAFRALVARDLKLAARIGGSGGLGLVFFLMLVTLVPFALGPDLNLLSRIGPAILWLAAVLATLIGLDRLFQADEEDGSLDLLRAVPAPLEVLVLAKVVAHWLTTGLPLAVASPLFGLLVALTPTAMAGTAVTLLVGTPALTFVGAIGAALTASIRRGGLILALLVLPLMIPTLIFGVSAANAATGGTIPFATPLLVLGALSLIAGVVSTFATAAALRHGE